MDDEMEAMEAAAEREIDVYRAEVDRVKSDAQVKLDAHRDEIGKLRKLLVRAVRELADSGLPSQNALGAELARDGGIEP